MVGPPGAGSADVTPECGGSSCTWQVTSPALSPRPAGGWGLRACRSLMRETRDEHDDRRLRVGSLFSDYGGLTLAVEEVFDGRTTWSSEINEPVRTQRARPNSTSPSPGPSPPLVRRPEPSRHHDDRLERGRTRRCALRRVSMSGRLDGCTAEQKNAAAGKHP